MLRVQVYSSGEVAGSVNVHGSQTPFFADTEVITSPYDASYPASSRTAAVPHRRRHWQNCPAAKWNPVSNTGAIVYCCPATADSGNSNRAGGSTPLRMLVRVPVLGCASGT